MVIDFQKSIEISNSFLDSIIIFYCWKFANENT